MASTKPAAKTVATTQTKPQTSSTALAPSKSTPLATVNDSFAGMEGVGFEGAGRDDLAIPFLVILQSGSPQCKRSDGAYIEGAAEGMLFNSVTKTIIDPMKTKVRVIPCAYERSFVEWKVREEGGGFVGQMDVAAGVAAQATTERDEKGRDILENGHQLNDTRSFYVMMLDEEDNPSPAFLNMTSTQIKKAKQWLMQQSLLKLKTADGRPYTPPMFASKWTVTTVAEANDKGSWFGWAFEHDGFFPSVDDPVFQSALAFHKSIATGAVKADLAKASEDISGDTIDADTGEVVGRRGATKEDKDPARAM